MDRECQWGALFGMLAKGEASERAWGPGCFGFGVLQQGIAATRPWVGTETPCSEIDKQLFRLCTAVTIGNGERARFWESAWLEGRAPRDLAPNLYKLAWRKNLSVREEI